MSSARSQSIIASLRVMLVGGGRWGRVHASVLMKLLPPGSEILWVSRHNYSTVLASAAERQGQALVTVIESLEQAIKRKPNAAIVVTAADMHARVAQTLLEHGIPTLVEKPFVLNTKDAVDLIELASASEIVLGVGLHLLFASYLSHFRSLWQNRPVAIARLQWLDSEVETRYGEVKRIDVSTPKVHDVFPHLWAILRVLFPAHETLVGDVKSLAGGSACLQFTMGDVAIHAHIGRRASARSRRVDLTFLDGGTAMLDFTNEPGTVTLNGNVVASDPDWGHQPTPLTAEVSGFLAAITDPKMASAWPCHAHSVIGSVRGAETAAERLAACEARRLAGLIPVIPNPADDQEIQALLIDNLAPELCLDGIRLTELSDQAMLVSGSLSILEKTGNLVSKGISVALREAVTKSHFLQQVATIIHSRG